VPVLEKPEATLSVRWLFPFLRLTGASPADLGVLRREGISLAEFANPDSRIRHTAVMDLLKLAVERTADPCLGLHAGERFEAGDVGALEYVARTCASLRESIDCSNRYMSLMHDAQESRLVVDGDRASWQLRTVDNVPQLPAANDFVVTGALWFARKHTGLQFPLREVHLRHAEPTSVSEYARVFDGALVRCGMHANALVFDRTYLDLPMVLAQPGLQAAFQLQIEARLDSRRRKQQTVSGRVRNEIIEHLASGKCAMPAVARRLAMSDATLRRRLADEDATFSGLVHEVRMELAEKYLADPTLAIRDVAFLLGFSHVTAFYKAFSRTVDVTPAQVRARLLTAHG
jgi:AraC-like DNA-binding protein